MRHSPIKRVTEIERVPKRMRENCDTLLISTFIQVSSPSHLLHVSIQAHDIRQSLAQLRDMNTCIRASSRLHAPEESSEEPEHEKSPLAL